MRVRRLLPLLGLLLLLTPTASAGSEPHLAFEKYQLDNGLTVILHEDASLPNVVVNIWYHVGSREEPPGRSGFAHLFEHLMFMGTERVPNGRFDEIMEAGGGSNNASTDFDRTNYFSWGPSNLLPVLLWLDAERMDGLGRAMTQQKLDLQRDVVRNERREGYDDAPYGEAELLVWETMFPKDHPYHHHIIGSHEDLQKATVDDVVRFFDTYYVPNNATLVVAGAFDRDETKRMIERWFGAVPRGKDPPRRSAPPAELPEDRRLVLHDDVQLPRLTLAWHSPAYFAPGDAEMDLIAGVLTDGEGSRLRKRLMHDEQIAVSVYAWQESLRLGSLLMLEVTAAPGVAPERLEAVVREEVGRLVAEGPTTEELDRIRSQIRTDTVASLESLSSLADQMNLYDAYLGTPDGLAFDLGRYEKATPEGVKGWAERVLRAPHLTMWVLPEGEEGPAEDVFATEPAPLEPAAWTPPAPVVMRMENGLEVWHLHRPGVPLVTARLLLPVGSAQDGAGHEGLASLAAQMLTEGAGDLDALAFAAELESRGIALGASAGQDSTVISLQTLRDHLDRALTLFGSMVKAPRFDEAAWDRIQRLNVRSLATLVDDPGSLADRVAPLALFGPGAAYGEPVGGWPASVAAITRDEARAFAERVLRPEGAILLVASDLPPERMQAALTWALGDWKAPPAPACPAPAAAAEGGGGLRVYLVDKPESTQTVVRFLFPGVPYVTPDRAGLDVMSFLFGGSFTSRLNRNLREEHGYTYGASSWFLSRETDGAFGASAAVVAEHTGDALREFLAELGRLRQGDVTEEEVAKAKAGIQSGLVAAYQTQSSALGQLAGPARYGLGPDGVARYQEAVAAVDVAAVNRLARRYGVLDGGVLVLVGDANVVRPQLEALGLPSPRVLSPEDALDGRLPATSPARRGQ